MKLFWGARFFGRTCNHTQDSQVGGGSCFHKSQISQHVLVELGCT